MVLPLRYYNLFSQVNNPNSRTPKSLTELKQDTVKFPNFTPEELVSRIKGDAARLKSGDNIDLIKMGYPFFSREKLLALSSQYKDADFIFRQPSLLDAWGEKIIEFQVKSDDIVTGPDTDAFDHYVGSLLREIYHFDYVKQGLDNTDDAVELYDAFQSKGLLYPDTYRSLAY